MEMAGRFAGQPALVLGLSGEVGAICIGELLRQSIEAIEVGLPRRIEEMLVSGRLLKALHEPDFVGVEHVSSSSRIFIIINSDDESMKRVREIYLFEGSENGIRIDT